MDKVTETVAMKAKINPAAMASLGSTMLTKFAQYEKDRYLAEQKWARSTRQFLGIYDPEIERALDPNRSRAYPKLTRVKVVSMLSRLMNLLFQVDDKCWGVKHSAVPNLHEQDLQTVLNEVAAAAQDGQIDSEMIEEAIRAFAKKRSAQLELEITDQLSELGGTSAMSFSQLCRQVLYSGILYGMGVLKGPFTEKQKQRKWQVDTVTGQLAATEVEVLRPRFEFVPIWNYYPDMSAKYLHQMEGQFERHVMSKHQIIMLKKRADFISSQIDEALRVNPTGNYKRKTFENELKVLGVQNNVSDTGRNKFEAISWEGYVSGVELSAAGVEVPESKMNEDLVACVWFIGNVVIKAELNAWSELDTDGEMPMYHHFIFEEDESTLIGNCLPSIMRDSQMNFASAVRMMIDNGSIMRVFEMNTELLSLNQDVASVTPDKIFYREDASPATAGIPAIRVIELPLRVAELKVMADMFQSLSDQETFVGAATGGDIQKGPSEPFRTAAGASMLRGDAALPFKDVVRNFDRFTESVIGSIIVFNRNFNTNPELRGDFEPVARGATSLIAKEVLGIQLDNFAATLTDGERPYVKMRELARARARVRDLIVEDIVVSDAEADKIDAANAAAQQAQTDMQNRMQEAELKDIQGGTLKAIAQAGKHTSASDAAKVKIILDALERDLPVEQILAMVARVDAPPPAAPAVAPVEVPLAAAMPAR